MAIELNSNSNASDWQNVVTFNLSEEPLYLVTNKIGDTEGR